MMLVYWVYLVYEVAQASSLHHVRRCRLEACVTWEALLNGHFESLLILHKSSGSLGKTKKIIYPSELLFFLYVSLSERK